NNNNNNDDSTAMTNINDILDSNSKILQDVYEKITQIEKKFMEFDLQYEELWNFKFIANVNAIPYSIFNDVDSEKLPILEFTFENLIHWDVGSPDEDYNYGCTCKDNCKDVTNCSCVQHGEVDYPFNKNGKLIRSDIGAIYECNSFCGCNFTCPNRIIQNSNNCNKNLQIFKTENKGWGVRTLKPIKEGSFVMEHL
ncbi:5080_t:CDS:2, partial [Dentiscutata erythropus]